MHIHIDRYSWYGFRLRRRVICVCSTQFVLLSGSMVIVILSWIDYWVFQINLTTCVRDVSQWGNDHSLRARNLAFSSGVRFVFFLICFPHLVLSLRCWPCPMSVRSLLPFYQCINRKYGQWQILPTVLISNGRKLSHFVFVFLSFQIPGLLWDCNVRIDLENSLYILHNHTCIT